MARGGGPVEGHRGPVSLVTRRAHVASSAPLTLRLRRWTNMRERGYLSGDTHVHFLSQAESHLQMRAEDLNIVNLLVSDFTNDWEKFTGRLDPVSTPGHAFLSGRNPGTDKTGMSCCWALVASSSHSIRSVESSRTAPSPTF